jgi:hypothetical protein
MEVIMKIKTGLIFALVLVVSLPLSAEDKHKKNPPARGMLEKMEAVPCGAKERGLTGLGSVFGSVGVQHVNSDEKLCPQYLFRTDEMEYEIRPLDHKHPAVLPVGHEAEFKVKDDRMSLRVPDGDRKKRDYQVVAARPMNHDPNLGSSATTPAEGADTSR